MVGLSIDQLSIGQSASFSKTISESDVYMFAGVTGDVNPAHINESYANATPFKTRIAHGMLSAGLISAVLRNTAARPRLNLRRSDPALYRAGTHRRYHHRCCHRKRAAARTQPRNHRNCVHQPGRHRRYLR